ncbi:MAG: AAA family ATPase [Nitrososphaera sp.]|jgi:MinD-like ATPase involved in chromosome partitioning or flagellar assembly
MATKCVAFHSYKGGTGKTTIASNIAALLAVKGFKVGLLDLDVYAPSLLAYFEKKPRKWLNDYLFGEAEVEDVMIPVTDTLLEHERQHGNRDINGKLWVGFSSVKKEDIYKIEAGTSEDTKSQLRKFILLRQNLIRDYELDYIIIDTSPGIRYWSMNALAVADILFLTLKQGDIDIEGTMKLASEIYGSLAKYGTKSFLLFNRVAGYCVPDHHTSIGKEQSSAVNGTYAENPQDALSMQTKMEVISAIPCYCDIQFSKKEFLTALRYPLHPFTRQLENLAGSLTAKL